jgi:hypothetical protein
MGSYSVEERFERPQKDHIFVVSNIQPELYLSLFTSLDIK